MGSTRRSWRLVAVLIAVVLLVPLSGALDLKPAHAGGGISTLRVRKNVKDLTPQEKWDIVDAIWKMKETPSPWSPNLSYYDQFVYWHKLVFKCDIDAAHMRPAFLPWHRMLTLLFENAMRQVSGKPITLPYWDWTDPASTRALFAPDFMGGNGDPNQNWAVTTGPFRKGLWHLNVLDPKVNDTYQFTWLVRNFGSYKPIAPTLPNKATVHRALTRPMYDVPPYDPASDPALSFRNNLEGWRERKGMSCDQGWMVPVNAVPHPYERLHNRVHLWVGGVFGNPKNPIGGTMTLNTSDNDPVFWFHHANIDRLAAAWWQTHNYQYEPVSGFMKGMNLNDQMWPYKTIGIHLTIKQLLDTRKLGYVYDQYPH